MVSRLKLTRPMKTPTSLLRSLKSGILGLAFLGLTLAATPTTQAAGAKAFQFTSSGANTSGSVMTLDHPALNGKSKLNLIINHRYLGNRNSHLAGLQYNSAAGRWQIRNEDGANIPLGEGFNVLLAPGTKRWPASPFTTGSYITYFPTLAKNKPNNLLLATHLIHTGQGYSGVLLTDSFSVYWDGQQWSIYNDNFAQTKAVGFNIADVTKLKAGGAPAAFKVITNGANISGDAVVLDNPLTNGKPNAVVFARHMWQSQYLTTEAGVYYNGTNWVVYNEDNSAMTTNHAFVVAVIPQATP